MVWLGFLLLFFLCTSWVPGSGGCSWSPAPSSRQPEFETPGELHFFCRANWPFSCLSWFLSRASWFICLRSLRFSSLSCMFSCCSLPSSGPAPLPSSSHSLSSCFNAKIRSPKTLLSCIGPLQLAELLGVSPVGHGGGRNWLNSSKLGTWPWTGAAGEVATPSGSQLGHGVRVEEWDSPPPPRRRETLRAACKTHRRPKLTATTVMTFDSPVVQTAGNTLHWTSHWKNMYFW